ncbi:MAG: right-handed parallel beta-helix repeat-containing protein, partial [Planctomycetota bacterium]
WCQADFSPAIPTSEEAVTILLFGVWGSSCVPNDSAFSIVDNSIYIDVIWDYPEFTGCEAVMTYWESSNEVGTLSTGVYTVFGRLVGYPYPSSVGPYERLTDFTVTDRQFVLSSESLVVPEGDSTSFTIRSVGDPNGPLDVTVGKLYGDADIAVSSGETLVFDSTDYFIPKTVIISGAQDGDFLNGTARFEITAELFVSEADDDMPRIVYVDGDAGGAQTGRNWADAFTDLTEALAAVAQTPEVEEVRVAQGRYVPSGPTPAAATFLIPADVAVRGGYAGFGAADPDVRDVAACETVLSGDVGENDVDIGELDDPLRHPSRSDNCHHVVKAVAGESTIMLDGFTISGGNAHWGSSESGGGMVVSGGRVVVARCKFESNSAVYGGAMVSTRSSSIEIANSVFRGNWSYSQGGAILSGGKAFLTDCAFDDNVSFYGGAICSDGSTEAKRCVFTGNFAGWFGGSIKCWLSGPLVLSDCVFAGNTAGRGGGVFGFKTPFDISNCLFSDNLARGVQDREGFGGGIYTDSYLSTAPVEITECTIVGNRAAGEVGGGIYTTGGEILNCILRGNRSSQSLGESGQLRMPHSAKVNYSCVEGWTGSLGGAGNFDADPAFADPNGGDYHLKSQGGRWDPNEGRWTIDDVTSPCVDAGDPMSPVGAEAFPNGGIVNMGAYGGTSAASKSYFGGPPCGTVMAGDVNGDCVIDFEDFRLMCLHWLENNTP